MTVRGGGGGIGADDPNPGGGGKPGGSFMEFSGIGRCKECGEEDDAVDEDRTSDGTFSNGLWGGEGE